MKKRLTIALVAHDNRKADMVEWVKHNAELLSHHHLVCTGTTGRLIKEAFESLNIEADVTCMNSGPLGGDAEIAALEQIDPKRTAVVDERFAAQLEGFTPQPDSTATITLSSYRPNKLVYASHAQTDQVAVFSEIYYQPGWKATIDGKPADHFRADWILRAMRIPAGEHEIIFEFKPEGYIIAANVEAYSSFLILLLLIVAVGYSIYKEVKK